MAETLHIGDPEVDKRPLTALCERYRARKLAFFGSAARGQMRPDSDIDILVDFMPNSGIDLVDYAGLMMDLSQLLGRRVDLVSKKGLKPLIRESVLKGSLPSLR